MDLSALRRPGARRRWATVVAAVAVLCALPVAVAAIPADPRPQPVQTLLAKVAASGNTPYEGYAMSSGLLNLPDIGQFADALDLLSATSRLRVWWRDGEHYRVDSLRAGGETDVYRDGLRNWRWDSERRQATIRFGPPTIPSPVAPDATPPSIGRRLLAAVAAAQVRTIPAARIAGRDALGLRVDVTDARSLVGRVSVWVDPGSGLPMRVEVTPAGRSAPAFRTEFLDLRLTTPSVDTVTFRPRDDPTADVQREGSARGRRARSRLPAVLAGLPQRSPPSPDVATYGVGYALMAVVEVPQSLAQSIRDKVDAPSRPPVVGGFGTGSQLSTPLLAGLAVATQDRGWLLAGTVTPAELQAAATALVQNPPAAAR